MKLYTRNANNESSALKSKFKLQKTRVNRLAYIFKEFSLMSMWRSVKSCIPINYGVEGIFGVTLFNCVLWSENILWTALATLGQSLDNHL